MSLGAASKVCVAGSRPKYTFSVSSFIEILGIEQVFVYVCDFRG